jgi:penicillin-binding protein 1A
VKPNHIRLLLIASLSVIGLTLLAGYAIVCSYVYLEPSLPSAATMKNIELQVPLRVYSRGGELIAQIGEQRRIPVAYENIPKQVRQAFIAAEDDRFFEHSGIDWQGVLRSLFVNLTSGDFSQGGSTITMQAARNMFLTQDKKIRRKLQEVFLTYRMEREFTKEEILGLYLNVIFFGQRSYGVAAAAETYFGKTLDQLTLSEAATLARVPQWPSRYNPITNPTGAGERRSYVLRRMRELGFVDVAAAEAASREPILARSHRPLFQVEAPYVAEMVRLEVVKRFGVASQNAGYKVYTTIDGRLQAAANRAVRMGLVEYDRRHGWRGATNKVELKGGESAVALEKLLDEYTNVGVLAPAIVTSLTNKSARVYVKTRGMAALEWAGMSWARKYETELLLGPEPKVASDILARGDVVYVVPASNGSPLLLAQVPEAESALVALDPNDGAIVSLVGGFDYFDKGLGKFNRVTQAKRQPGSGFKPFLYASALAGEFTPASVIVDAPIIVDDLGSEEIWRPQNSSGEFGGPTRLREALVRSRNLVSIRLLKEIGTKPVIEYVQNFGFTKASLPANLTLALGTMQATPLEVARGYAVFANGGYLVEPYFIDRIDNPTGETVYSADPFVVCEECEDGKRPAAEAAVKTAARAGEKQVTGGGKRPFNPDRVAKRAISREVAFLMNDIMGDVIKRGTGRRALALGRGDIGGKTGTTNDSIDTWFNGFNRNLVASVWVGFDQIKPLGEGEEGSRTAVPIWLTYMQEALKNVPQRTRSMPEGIVQMKVSPNTGALVGADDGGIFEYFRTDRLPNGNILGDPGALTMPSSTDGEDTQEPAPVSNDQIF